MKRILLAVLITSFAVGSAMAQSCATKAVSKDGKPLAGAAKTSFIKKCCEDSAVSKDGKRHPGKFCIVVLHAFMSCYAMAGPWRWANTI